MKRLLSHFRMMLSLFSDFEPVTEATFSTCGRYRYQLKRQWDKNKPAVLFIMLNPSTADAINPDNTVTRCINFARDWGFGTLIIANLFAYKDTEPTGLLKADDPIGRDNISYLQKAVYKADLIVCAWGNKPILKKLDVSKQMQVLCSTTKPLKCLKISADGTPIHPLYLPKTLRPIPFSVANPPSFYNPK